MTVVIKTTKDGKQKYLIRTGLDFWIVADTLQELNQLKQMILNQQSKRH